MLEGIWSTLVEWGEVIWRTLIGMELSTIALIVASFINAGAIVALVIITKRYVHYTGQLVEEERLSRRDNPELEVRLYEPKEQEMTLCQIIEPSGTFLVFNALLTNPGAVPIVIDNVAEKLSEQESKKKVKEEFKFALPQETRPEQVSLYIFRLPWVIPSDGFAFWSRCQDTVINKDIKYELNVQFDYSVVGKPKPAMTAGPLSLTPRHGSG